MKRWTKNLLLLPSLIAALGLMLAGRLTAQTFTVLHGFTAYQPYLTNSDGASPYTGLILSGNTLFGTADYGGSSGNGTVFAINTDGTGFTNLHSFTVGGDGVNPMAGLLLSGNTLYGTASSGGSFGGGTVFALNTDGTGFTNLHSFMGGGDGANPLSGLTLSGNTLYGTAAGGSSFGAGTVFAVNTNGTGFTNLHSFTGGGDGANPRAGLTLSGNSLYGTTQRGASSGWGTVFALNTDGTDFTTLHSFSAATGFDSFGNPINSDGANPVAGLLLSGNVLYGTAGRGGSSGAGTVFKVNTDGTGFTNLHNFTATADPYYKTNTDGANPKGSLILSDSTLYGTAVNGGNLANGTVFAINTDGTGFRNLHNFTFGRDGAYPYGGLVLLGNTLYGTTQSGGSGSGTVFAVNTDGTDFTTLYTFSALPVSLTNSDGAHPYSSLILSGNTLYGTAWQGGSSGNGTVFSLFIQPQLTIIPSGANIILTWPTNYPGFTLQSTTNLVSPVWTTNLASPVVVNGQYTVTNPISGTKQFFRLSQ